ncbi:Blp family class II bacteriocin [Streptococcus orisasini]
MVTLDSTVFKSFDEIDINHLASVEGGFDTEGVANSYLAMGTAILGELACTTLVGAAFYLGAELCAAAAAIYYDAN